jgi:hypothetical protein
MSSTPLLKLKTPKGWFAAGAEMQNALMLLPDGPFKTFVYVCLHARRDTGTLETSANTLAKELAKASGTVRSHLRQLEVAGVCRCRMTQNPHVRGVIEVTEAFWPYDRGEEKAGETEETTYIDTVRKRFLERACVRSSFSVSDTRLAREWYAQGIPLDKIEHTILLGCIRKYTSWRNGQSTAPIASLRYFEAALEEVRSQNVSQDYWEYLCSRLTRLERLWLQEHGPSPKSENPVPEFPPET